jgi:hypothetical protein
MKREVELDAPDSEPRLLAAWMSVRQAELMLGHLATAGAEWPEANLYLHSCITALRSVTLVMQKALTHEPGFEAWHAEVRGVLAADPEFVFLKEARNFVLKEGALRLMMSFQMTYSGPLGMKMTRIGPDGPEIWVRHEGASEWVPADWRRLDGFEFDIPLRLAQVEGLPAPPERELREMLREKIWKLRLILHEAEARFDPTNADTTQAQADERALGRSWRD